MKLGANFPMGPLALGDLIGLDVCLAIMETLAGNTAKTSTVRTYICARWSATARLGRKAREEILQVLNNIKISCEDRVSKIVRLGLFRKAELDRSKPYGDKNSLKLFRNY